ncbi:hypothetical protein RND71_039704 [Anisodus tanguticus]|uniref:Uncharacterized protein n=1 Tax=Anisodus tanguticus TaxID=243964 RepID=A0AAE1QX92_9SOLA|nr:hypothetical protein RND71_039704 [Anisodus tanguticus]
MWAPTPTFTGRRGLDRIANVAAYDMPTGSILARLGGRGEAPDSRLVEEAQSIVRLKGEILEKMFQLDKERKAIILLDIRSSWAFTDSILLDALYIRQARKLAIDSKNGFDLKFQDPQSLFTRSWCFRLRVLTVTRLRVKSYHSSPKVDQKRKSRSIQPFERNAAKEKEGKSMDRPHHLHPVGTTRSPQGRLRHPGVTD